MLPRDGPSRHRVGGSLQIIPVVGCKKQSPSTHCIQYTEADLDPYAISDARRMAGYFR